MRTAIVAGLLCVMSCSLCAGGQLPIEESDFPGLFKVLVGDDVEDVPPSIAFQLGDGGLLGETQAVVPHEEIVFPHVDADGNTDESITGALFDTPELLLEVVPGGEPTGYVRLRPDGSMVDVQLDMRVSMVLTLNGTTLPPIEQDIRMTTGHVEASASGFIGGMFIHDTKLDGVPFQAGTGEGELVSAFKIPDDLPQEVINALDDIIDDMGIPFVSGRDLEDQPIGFEVAGVLLPTAVVGDVNEDDCVNVADLLQVRNNLGNSGSAIVPPGCDVTDDGTVNVADLLSVRNELGSGFCE